MTRTTADERQADVIVVGAGPAGAGTAYHLAQAGRRRAAAGEDAFPRDKICGDGLTPRAVKQLIAMGIDLDEPGWQKNKGLRIVGGGHRLELPWPDLADFPPYGAGPHPHRLRRDPRPARRRRPAPGCMERTAVTGPVLDERTGRVVGVTAKPVDDRGRKVGDEVTYRAPVVVAADGVSRPAGHRAGPRAPREPPDGRRRPRLLRDPAPRRRLDGVVAGAVGRRARAEQPAARLRLDLRRRRRHRQRRPRHPQHLGGLPARRLQGPAAALARPHAGGVGLPRREPGRPDRLGARCRWASTASRTTPAACCWSATPAAWSTRSTARASTTRWSPGRWRPTIDRAGARPPDGPARERVLAGLRRGARRGVRRLLHARAASSRR